MKREAKIVKREKDKVAPQKAKLWQNAQIVPVKIIGEKGHLILTG